MWEEHNDIIFLISASLNFFSLKASSLKVNMGFYLKTFPPPHWSQASLPPYLVI
jgi:hypothetical protein